MRYISAEGYHSALQDAYGAAHHHHHGGIADATCVGCAVAAEGSFLRAVAGWEKLIIEIILQLMQGYGTRGRASLHSYTSTTYGSSALAEAQLLLSDYRPEKGVQLKKRPSKYILLHDPLKIADVADFWLKVSPLSTICRQHTVKIRAVMTLRHGIAHGSDDAARNMRDVILQYEPLKSYSKAGFFLLDRPSVGAQTWLEFFLSELHDWAYSSAPY